MSSDSIRPNGKLIKELRMAKEWTQEYFAKKKVGRSKRTIENVEAGKRVRMCTLREIAQALGVSYETLLEGTPTANSTNGATPVAEGPATDESAQPACHPDSRDEADESPSRRISVILPVTMEIVGRYRLEQMIGRSISAEVWRGFDEQRKLPVAVKVPRSDRRRSPKATSDFLAEARRATRLDHRNIVKVYDVGQEGEDCYIVSDLVGPDLGQFLRSSTFPVREAVRIATVVAEALSFAHGEGVVHRGLKPSNILLNSREQVFLTDFGVGASAEELRQCGVDGLPALSFMSPEQVRGARVDSGADLYSLGVVLYELLTGQRPFRGDDPEALRKQILHAKARRPRLIEPHIPREVERICLRCLEKEPSGRHRTAKALALELRQASPR
jgi:serine/threonine protein kinase/DNA-binding XRE family transcriptional regulator